LNVFQQDMDILGVVFTKAIKDTTNQYIKIPNGSNMKGGESTISVCALDK